MAESPEQEDYLLPFKVFSAFAALVLTVVIVMLIIAGQQRKENAEECEERGGIQINQYYCVDKDSIR